MNDERNEWIELPTDEEIKELFEKDKALFEWAQTLTQEQIDYLCNGGWYNNTIRGYLIAAAKNADFTDEEIKNLLGGLRFALSEKNKKEAEQVSDGFY